MIQVDKEDRCDIYITQHNQVPLSHACIWTTNVRAQEQTLQGPNQLLVRRSGRCEILIFVKLRITVGGALRPSPSRQATNGATNVERICESGRLSFDLSYVFLTEFGAKARKVASNGLRRDQKSYLRSGTHPLGSAPVER